MRVGDLVVSIRLGRTPDEREAIEEERRARERRRWERWARDIERLGYVIEPLPRA